jgi:hypothetical protein
MGGRGSTNTYIHYKRHDQWIQKSTLWSDNEVSKLTSRSSVPEDDVVIQILVGLYPLVTHPCQPPCNFTSVAITFGARLRTATRLARRYWLQEGDLGSGAVILEVSGTGFDGLGIRL